MGRSLKFSVSAGEIAKELGLPLVGDLNCLVSRVDAANSASASSLCFAKNGEWVKKVNPDAILVTSTSLAVSRPGSATLLSDNPRLDFAKALIVLERIAGFTWSNALPEIHPTAIIGRNVILGNGVKVGAGTVIYHNVVIGDEVTIGDRCVIKSGAVIGEEGFGFERDTDGRGIRLPHVGSVIIGDDVEIGSLSTVCRGTLGDTILLNGCKIDDHVHIAHNVEVGENAFVIACAEISGGVKIGARAWIAPNACILNQVTVGDDAFVGLGSVVVRSVSDQITVVGNPAKPLRR